MWWYKKLILKNKKYYLNIFLKKQPLHNNIITSILAHAPYRVNNNFFFKCKNAWVGLKAHNVFAPSPSSNKIFSKVAQWIAHGRVAANTPATNFFPFNFFSFKIFPILFFSSLNFFYFLLFNIFILYKSWGMIIFFHFRLSWIFLLKHVCFSVSKNTLKNFENCLFFSLLQINTFWCFYIILMWWYKK